MLVVVVAINEKSKTWNFSKEKSLCLGKRGWFERLRWLFIFITFFSIYIKWWIHHLARLVLHRCLYILVMIQLNDNANASYHLCVFFLFDILKYSIQFKISIKLKFLSGWLVCHYIIEAGPLLRKKVQSIILYANVCVCVKKGNSVWFNFLFEVDKLVNRWLVGWMNGYDNWKYLVLYYYYHQYGMERNCIEKKCFRK